MRNGTHKIRNPFQRRLLLASLLVFAALLPRPALAEEPDFLISATPSADQSVQSGQTIEYVVQITERSAEDSMTYLRVQLGEGLHFVQNSLEIIDAPAASGKTPAPVERTVIPGDDGFVLLTPKLRVGDLLTFSAIPRDNAALTLSVQTERASSTIAHMLATPVPVASTSAPFTRPTPRTPIRLPEDTSLSAATVALRAALVFGIAILGIVLAISYNLELKERFFARLHRRHKDDSPPDDDAQKKDQPKAD